MNILASDVKEIYKTVIVPYTLFLLYLMFFGMGRFQYEDNLITVEPVFSTIKFIQGYFWKDIVIIVLGNIVMFIPLDFWAGFFPS
jgi:glycopeptide antibiotics resistance protein